jgi:hypothetical protein
MLAAKLGNVQKSLGGSGFESLKESWSATKTGSEFLKRAQERVLVKVQSVLAKSQPEDREWIPDNTNLFIPLNIGFALTVTMP